MVGTLDLRCCDCMDLMREHPDGHFDLAIVDPPYGIRDSGGQTGGKGKLKNRIFNNGVIDRWDSAPKEEYFFELTRVSSNQIIWGGNYFDLPPSRGFCIWDKKQPWENFSRCEYAWLSMPVPSKIYEFDNRTSDKIHPTQKPVALYKWLLKNYAKQGDKILDTHVGSASSLIACYDMGFDAVGFELDPDYYATSKRRLEDFMRQPKLEELVNTEYSQTSLL